MYEVWVYDEPLGSFVPIRLDGKRVEFFNWEEAEYARVQFSMENPNNQYKVEYATVKRRRNRR